MKVSALVVASLVLSVSAFGAPTPPLFPENFTAVWAEFIQLENHNTTASGTNFVSSLHQSTLSDVSTLEGKSTYVENFRTRKAVEFHYDFGRCHEHDLPPRDQFPGPDFLKRENATYIGTKTDPHLGKQVEGWKVTITRRDLGKLDTTIWITADGEIVAQETDIPERKIYIYTVIFGFLKNVILDTPRFFDDHCPFTTKLSNPKTQPAKRMVKLPPFGIPIPL